MYLTPWNLIKISGNPCSQGSNMIGRNRECHFFPQLTNHLHFSLLFWFLQRTIFDQLTPEFKADLHFSVLDNSCLQPFSRSLLLSPFHFLLEPRCPFTLAPSLSLRGIFQSDEPRVRMFHCVTLINSLSPAAQRQRNLVPPSFSKEVRDGK